MPETLLEIILTLENKSDIKEDHDNTSNSLFKYTIPGTSQAGK